MTSARSVLVDTSVWVDHLRRHDAPLAALLSAGEVITHPFVIGELACGNLRRRDTLLALLQALPTATVASHEEALHLVSQARLHGKGLGWVDAHLLAAACLTTCRIWTRDKALAAAAAGLGVARR